MVASSEWRYSVVGVTLQGHPDTRLYLPGRELAYEVIAHTAVQARNSIRDQFSGKFKIKTVTIMTQAIRVDGEVLHFDAYGNTLHLSKVSARSWRASKRV